MAERDPRYLRVLRVEDERVPSPADRSPVTDLGRIGKWSDFCRALATGTLTALNAENETVEIVGLPDILTVDFRFDWDASTPSFRLDPQAATHPVYGNLSWSGALQAKNTGVLIGATLMGVAADRDLPLATVLHTLVPDHTKRDVSTVLLVGQILAHGGADEFCDPKNDPVALAYDKLSSLPRNYDEAVPTAVQSFRRQLLERCGATVASAVRLFIDGDAAQELLVNFDLAASDADLDARLEKNGLVLIDRDDGYDSIDVRSLFLDLLDPDPAPGRNWGMLPLRLVKADGPVFAFIRDLHDRSTANFARAAEVVQENAKRAGSCPVMSEKSSAVRLFALIFAYVEAYVSGASRPTQSHAAPFLGLDAGVTTEFTRIVEAAGRRGDARKRLIGALTAGPLPPHLAQAATWYVKKFHPDRASSNCPPQCTIRF